MEYYVLETTVDNGKFSRGMTKVSEEHVPAAENIVEREQKTYPQSTNEEDKPQEMAAHSQDKDGDADAVGAGETHQSTKENDQDSSTYSEVSEQMLGETAECRPIHEPARHGDRKQSITNFGDGKWKPLTSVAVGAPHQDEEDDPKGTSQAEVTAKTTDETNQNGPETGGEEGRQDMEEGRKADDGMDVKVASSTATKDVSVQADTTHGVEDKETTKGLRFDEFSCPKTDSADPASDTKAEDKDGTNLSRGGEPLYQDTTDPDIQLENCHHTVSERPLLADPDPEQSNRGDPISSLFAPSRGEKSQQEGDTMTAKGDGVQAKNKDTADHSERALPEKEQKGCPGEADGDRKCLCLLLWFIFVSRVPA